MFQTAFYMKCNKNSALKDVCLQGLISYSTPFLNVSVWKLRSSAK